MHELTEFALSMIGSEDSGALLVGAEFAIIAAHTYVLYQLLLDTIDAGPAYPAWRRWVPVSVLLTGVFQVFHFLALNPQSSTWLMALAVGLGGCSTLLAIMIGRTRMSDAALSSLLMLGFLAGSVIALNGHAFSEPSEGSALGRPREILIIAGSAGYLVSAGLALRLGPDLRRGMGALVAYCVSMAGACLLLVLVGDYQTAHAWTLVPRTAAAAMIAAFAWLSFRHPQHRNRSEEGWTAFRPAAPSIGRRDRSRPDIFAVDDDPLVLELMQATLGELGNVTPLTSRREVETRLARGEMPDLVVLDLNLEDGQAHDLVPAFFRNRGAAERLVIYSVESYPSRLLPKGARSLLKSETPIDRLREIAMKTLAGSTPGTRHLGTAI